MVVQLNIFDSMKDYWLLLLNQKKKQLTELNQFLKSAQRELDTYNPDDYEDRRDINACRAQIRDLEQQIKQTESEIAHLTNEISHSTNASNEFNKSQQRQM